MDELLKDILGNSGETEEQGAPAAAPEAPTPEPTPVEPIPAPAVSVAPTPVEPTPAEPAAPEAPTPVEPTPAESAAEIVEPTPVEPIPAPAVPVEPTPAENTVPAPKPAQHYAPPYTPQYAAPPQPKKNVFYNPPGQTAQANVPPYTPYNAYREPQPYQGDAPTAPPKKKKKTAKLVILLIAVLCAALAFGGMGYAVRHYEPSSSSSGSSSSNPLDGFLDEDNDKDDKTDDDDASASVKSSNEAATKDKNGNYTVAGVAKNAKGSCVGITVYTKQDAFNYFYGYGEEGSADGEEVASGEGSGVIMSEANGKTYIMTCAHVIADGSTFKVTLDNDKEYDARIVGVDSQTDIGVLVIDATGLQIAEFGDSEDIQVGEDCVAIGCPGGLDFKNSVTKGIVSALDVPVASQIGYNNECIQVDAAINPGNSGGALFNMQGQVIGINSSKIASTEYEGMGFAVPSNTAVETANSLIKNGYVKGRAKLGITYNTLSNYNSAQSILQALEEKGFKNAEGTMVINDLSSDSDLNGKVEQYDMIVAVNGKTLTSVDVLTSVLSKSKPGDTVKLTVARIEGNSLKTFDVSCKLIESKE